MKRALIIVYSSFLVFCLAFALSGCGEPDYTGPASFYDERVQEDVLDACGYLEDANWDIDILRDMIYDSLERGEIKKETAEALFNCLHAVEEDVRQCGEKLGYW